ncbi:MAG: hypothetical protein M9932_02380 [Xanthobacteraceae bacterium]|nr:hypothetical protein [Xanthobacteraceae bacterium]
MIAPDDVDLRSLFPPAPRRLGVGDVAMVGRVVFKVVDVVGHMATLVRILDDRLVYATCPVRALTSLDVALSPQSTWLTTSNRDAIAVIIEEEEAKAAEKARKAKSRKAKPSKRIRKRA